MDIGCRIKHRRELLGLSQEELAIKVGYKSRSSINKIEIDGRGLPQSKIIAFAKALETTPSYLMGWETEDGIELIAPKLALTDAELDLIKKNSYENLVALEMEKLNQKGKVRLLDVAREMTCNPLYNDNYKVEVDAAHERTDIEITDEMRQNDDDIMDDDNF